MWDCLNHPLNSVLWWNGGRVCVWQQYLMPNTVHSSPSSVQIFLKNLGDIRQVLFANHGGIYERKLVLNFSTYCIHSCSLASWIKTTPCFVFLISSPSIIDLQNFARFQATLSDLVTHYMGRWCEEARKQMRCKKLLCICDCRHSH